MSDAAERAAQLTKAVFEFMEAIRPKGGVFGLPGPSATRGLPCDEVVTDEEPPYVHRLGATRGPAFSVRRLLAPWEPPLSQFGTWVSPVDPFPVKTKTQEIPEAFRRR